MLIEYKNAEVYQETQEVLTGVSFTVDEGEFIYIVGKVGSGKSSLLKTIYGELPIHGGEASVMDYNLTDLKRKHLPELRRKLGIIFQDFQLLTDRTVEANLKFVLRATGWKNKMEIQTRIQEVLELVGMSTKGYKLPSELSGGEQQRIAIARAILNHPKLILADEPTGNLDAETSKKITELLHKVVKEQGATVLMITHNTHLVELYPGRVFECKNKVLTETSKDNKIKDKKKAKEEAKPTDTPKHKADFKPVGETKSANETKPVGETKSASETKSVGEAKPTNGAKPAIEVKPDDDKMIIIEDLVDVEDKKKK